MLRGKKALLFGSSGLLDVTKIFAATIYTSTGSAVALTTGIDLSTYGGLTIDKTRSVSGSSYWTDSARGTTKYLTSDSTNAESTGADRTFTTSGSNTVAFTTGDTAVKWTFRKSARFFDVVTWTHSGSPSTNRRIAHSLGVAPGMIFVKNATASINWYGYSIALGRSSLMRPNLNSQAVALTNFWGSADPTSTDFGIDEVQTSFTAGDTIVAYVFAHDVATDGVVQCGSYAGNGLATGPTITLGWEPQFIMLKNSTTVGYDWYVLDTARGLGAGSEAHVWWDLQSAEGTGGTFDFITTSSTGFQLTTTGGIRDWNGSGDTYIYMAIRKP